MPHIPVMYEQCLEGLAIRPDGVYLDMTLGGFGHGRGICQRLSEKGTYIGIDLDPAAIERGKELSAGFACRKIFVHSHFNDFASALEEHGVGGIDGCLMDLGVSSFQLDDSERGFSFLRDGPLDMRMDAGSGMSAADVINGYEEERLKALLYEYGEERFAPRIAREIAKRREEKPFATTGELAEAVKAAVPRKFWQEGKNPATRTFQAVRIEVNEELSGLYDTVCAVIDRLNSGGRLCVMSFHSLEDKLVKAALVQKSKGCTCPKDFPVCVCGKTPQIKVITKSPVTANESERNDNPRSRSAKLRVAEKLK